MQSDFWIQRWQEGQIGFHQEEINDYLLRHWPAMQVQKGQAVLVPLCGKSKDMLWLRQQGYAVTGVEVSSLAIDAFIEENRLQCSMGQDAHFTTHRCDNMTLLCGDFFKMDAAHMQNISAVYDRASFIALPPEMRQDYARHLTNLLAAGSKVLLVTMEYPQHEMDGPPFAVHEEEVRDLYAGAFSVEVVGEVDVLENNARFKERGLTSMREKSYLLVKS